MKNCLRQAKFKNFVNITIRDRSQENVMNAHGSFSFDVVVKT
jgi:hypothetical protein